MEPIVLQLMEPNCKAIHARAYTVPRSADYRLQAEQGNYRIGGHWSPWIRLFLWMDFHISIICNSKEIFYCWNIECHPYPIPKIENRDKIRSIEGVSFASALDLNMGYYQIKLDADAQKICAIVFQWHMEKYKCKRKPMGIKIAFSVMFFKKSCLT
jgi:hypothetical protein